MELAQVKAAVKSWEKAFRALHHRDPTKEDIKRDSGNIAEQYALYRKLSKASSSSQPQSQGHGQSSSRNLQIPSASTSSSQNKSTPRTVPASEYPTTPTPPSRSRSRQASVNGVYAPSSQQAGPSRVASTSASASASRTVETPKKSLKRTASKAALRSSPPPTGLVPPLPASSGKTLFSTPKKAAVAYSGPVYDPNPVNPFAISTPTRKSPQKSPTVSISRVYDLAETHTSQASSSPFIHASSPRKLKEVLEANSLRKVRERGALGGGGMEITPRTRARKRLRGEPVEDTPLKDKVPRRRRGQGQGQGRAGDNLLGVPGAGRSLAHADRAEHNEDEDEDEDEEGEDEFGPSPLKAVDGTGKPFATLFAEAEGVKKSTLQTSNTHNTEKDEDLGDVGPISREDLRRGRPSEMMGLFGKIGRAATGVKGRSMEQRANGNGSRIDGSTSSSSSRRPSIAIHVSGSQSPTPAPDVERSIRHSSPEDSTTHKAIAIAEASSVIGDEPARLPTPPLDPALEAASRATPTTSQKAKQARREKVLTLSDDEEDEWDPEGGQVKRRVVIVPTKRAVQRRRGSDSDSNVDIDSLASVSVDVNGHAHPDGTADESDAHEEEEAYGSPSPSLMGVGEGKTHTHSSTVPSPTALAPPLPLLSMLSLHSPQAPRKSKRAMEIESLRVKALFDPAEAARLRAIQRGQQVVFSGEAEAEGAGENELLDRYDKGLLDVGQGGNEGGEGGEREREDDDWESESEGWKRTTEDDDGW